MSLCYTLLVQTLGPRAGAPRAAPADVDSRWSSILDPAREGVNRIFTNAYTIAHRLYVLLPQVVRSSTVHDTVCSSTDSDTSRVIIYCRGIIRLGLDRGAAPPTRGRARADTESPRRRILSRPRSDVHQRPHHRFRCGADAARIGAAPPPSRADRVSGERRGVTFLSVGA